MEAGGKAHTKDEQIATRARVRLAKAKGKELTKKGKDKGSTGASSSSAMRPLLSLLKYL